MAAENNTIDPPGLLRRSELLLAMGLLGISLASAMLFVGLAAAIHSVEAHIAVGFGDRARGFMIIPVSTMLFFALAVSVAITNRSRPEIHKRWILLASIAILMAAVARIVRFVRFGTDIPPGPPVVEMSVVPALGTDLLIVVAMIHDWRTRSECTQPTGSAADSGSRYSSAAFRSRRRHSGKRSRTGCWTSSPRTSAAPNRSRAAATGVAFTSRRCHSSWARARPTTHSSPSPEH